MIKEAIEKILGLARPEIVTVNDVKYCREHLKPVLKPDFRPENLNLHTLTGITDYVKDNIESNDIKKMFIHVRDYNKVILYGKHEGELCERTIFLTSTLDSGNGFPYGQNIDTERFLINLQTLFVPTDELNELKKIAGGIRKQDDTEVQDDGIAQTVSVKKGVHLAANISIPNPMDLKPYRTFTEVDQPESKFVFRINTDESFPKCALHEADGEAWKLEAIQLIAEYFKNNLPGMKVIS